MLAEGMVFLKVRLFYHQVVLVDRVRPASVLWKNVKWGRFVDIFVSACLGRKQYYCVCL